MSVTGLVNLGGIAKCVYVCVCGGGGVEKKRGVANSGSVAAVFTWLQYVVYNSYLGDSSKPAPGNSP